MNWIKNELIPIKLRIIQFLKLWITFDFNDFYNKELKIKFNEFLELLNLTNGNSYVKILNNLFKNIENNENYVPSNSSFHKTRKKSIEKKDFQVYN
jgi:hypothetical protein